MDLGNVRIKDSPFQLSGTIAICGKKSKYHINRYLEEVYFMSSLEDIFLSFSPLK